jgi:hypothetical protein
MLTGAAISHGVTKFGFAFEVELAAARIRKGCVDGAVSFLRNRQKEEIGGDELVDCFAVVFA